MALVEFINDSYTEDGLRLPMVHFPSEKKDICVICIHGMCGTIVDNYFATIWGDMLSKNNIGFIYEHNRGHSIENDIIMKDGSYKRCGCMYEIFEECLYDIDLVIDKANDLGYKKIILLGHSYGCNKIIYYYYKKKPNLLGIVLASAPDMSYADKEHEKLIIEAKENIDKNEPMKLLHKMVEDYMYFSSQTYYNWYNENTNISNLPVVKNPDWWEQFSQIDVPILTFSGTDEEDRYLHLNLLQEKALKCPTFSYEYIKDSGHTYSKKENETGKLILDWVKKL
jgi:Lysophospholipase